jgi:hypothetical protein
MTVAEYAFNFALVSSSFTSRYVCVRFLYLRFEMFLELQLVAMLDFSNVSKSLPRKEVSVAITSGLLM